MNKPNGKNETPDPFDVLRNAALALSQARNKGERMHRVKACFDHVEAIQRGFAEVSQELGHCLAVLRDETKGSFATLRVGIPPGTKRLRVVDAEDKGVPIVSPSQMRVLVRPTHVLPLTVILEATNGAETRVTITPPEEPQPGKVAIAPE